MPVIEGSVERIVFRNEENGYIVARILTSDQTRLFRDDLVTIVGMLGQIAVGEMIECTGEWEHDPVHGRQLRVNHFITHTPISPKALARFLGSGIIKGIGPKTAERIVDHFGEQTLAVIELEPERLTDVKGISISKRDAIVAGWNDQRAIRDLMVFLQGHNISPVLARKIYAHYGKDAVAIIKENPYRLEQEVYGIGFKTADSIAISLGLPRDALPRLATGIKYALIEASANGHCYLPREMALLRASELLEVDGTLLPLALDSLTKSKEAFVEPMPSPLEGLELREENEEIEPPTRLLLGPFFFSELGVARRIRQMLQAEQSLPPLSPSSWDALIGDAESAQGIPLAEKQRDAVRMAYTNKISILTGGPGTGKTTTIRALVHILEKMKATYALAAPTGRAARRMTEATGQNASTLHRLLEYLPHSNTFSRNEERPLSVDIVIVDEMSMVDLILMYNLLKALPSETHLLIVGDADQLPSVGPGNVLHDLLASNTIPHIKLTELFRQAAESQIIVAAHNICDGAMPDTTPQATGDFFFMPADNDGDTARLILDLVLRRLPAKYGFDPVRDIQILGPMYKGLAGVTALNDAIQHQLRQSGDEMTVTAGVRTFHIGDKVMQIRNNYDKGVFNGDTGIITGIDQHEAQLTVAFSEEIVNYHFHELDEIVLAYAITIHRAQGSECLAVVMPLVMQHALLLQRNLLYTAITRAKKLCVLVGDPRALWRAVNNAEVTRRYTSLAERLVQQLPTLDAVSTTYLT
jgi:exodeoxyribonuclease V alpha subunit